MAILQRRLQQLQQQGQAGQDRGSQQQQAVLAHSVEMTESCPFDPAADTGSSSSTSTSTSTSSSSSSSTGAGECPFSAAVQPGALDSAGGVQPGGGQPQDILSLALQLSMKRPGGAGSSSSSGGQAAAGLADDIDLDVVISQMKTWAPAAAAAAHRRGLPGTGLLAALLVALLALPAGAAPAKPAKAQRRRRRRRRPCPAGSSGQATTPPRRSSPGRSTSSAYTRQPRRGWCKRCGRCWAGQPSRTTSTSPASGGRRACAALRRGADWSSRTRPRRPPEAQGLRRRLVAPLQPAVAHSPPVPRRW
jgi:hypothetical protein